MNNSQFRNLLQKDANSKERSDGPTSSAPASMLGSRTRSSIPMTPRTVTGQNRGREFSRQVYEHQQNLNGQPPLKKFKSSAAPKGSKLAAGYQDRTQLRRTQEDEVGEDKEKRLKALEEMFKLQQIDQSTFSRLRDEIGVGGSLESTHLVKGLDWKLLERVRKGEDVNTIQEKQSSDEEKPDLDAELDDMLEKDAVAATKGPKREETTEEPEPNGEVLTRNEILRRLKESRQASNTTAQLPEVSLSDKFKKVASSGKPKKEKFVETVNGRRREVLIIIDKDGNKKRKTRWIDKEEVHDKSAQRQNRNPEPLGMEVPADIAAKEAARLALEEAEDDDDIFQGVGTDYNPLAGIDDDDDDDASEDGLKPQTEVKNQDSSNQPRNYFGGKDTKQEERDQANPISKDPTLLAALKRAAALRQHEASARDSLDDESDDQKARKHREFLQKLKERDREDAQDMDLGFGESRFGDDDDEGDGPVWHEGEDEEKKSGRKRGPKKRKGNKDNVNDVMKVIEGRKGQPTK